MVIHCCLQSYIIELSTNLFIGLWVVIVKNVVILQIIIIIADNYIFIKITLIDYDWHRYI